MQKHRRITPTLSSYPSRAEEDTLAVLAIAKPETNQKRTFIQMIWLLGASAAIGTCILVMLSMGYTI